ncbi:isoprenylcysteine carboxylmethyltransferase family protein [Saccharomonospora sp. NPDC006951]
MAEFWGGLTLVVAVSFLALAFGLRAVIHRRSTGSWGFNRLGGKAWTAEWSAGILFRAAILAALAAPALQLTGTLAPFTAADNSAFRAAGAALTVAGIAITIVSQHVMGTSWRVGVDQEERTKLVTTGLFALVRNPVFTGMIIAFAGMALLTPNPVSVFGAGSLIAAIEIQVRAVEEPYLLRTHRDAYVAYATSVGRLVPGFGTLPDNRAREENRS